MSAFDLRQAAGRQKPVIRFRIARGGKTGGHFASTSPPSPSHFRLFLARLKRAPTTALAQSADSATPPTLSTPTYATYSPIS
jgi:hypothetical protein